MWYEARNLYSLSIVLVYEKAANPILTRLGTVDRYCGGFYRTGRFVHWKEIGEQ